MGRARALVARGGAATPVQPKYVSPIDPAARWSAADRGKAHFLHAANYLFDLENAVIVDPMQFFILARQGVLLVSCACSPRAMPPRQMQEE